MSANSRLVLGTRGSDLALAQARMVEAALVESGHSAESIEVQIIKTIGDKRPDLKLSEFSQGNQPVIDKGIFTKELEEALFREVEEEIGQTLPEGISHLDGDTQLVRFVGFVLQREAEDRLHRLRTGYPLGGERHASEDILEPG